MHLPSPKPSIPARKQTRKVSFALGSLVFLLTWVVFFSAITPAKADDKEPQPSPTPYLVLPPSLREPVMPENPLLADKGAKLYWGICMACHGDKGQGLTNEWRQEGFGEDMNCWKSRCHAANHPPEGFVFPRIVPPVIGPNTLQRYTTADELHFYILTTMPRWNPGSLSNEEAWALTAFLLRENGRLPKGTELNIKEAALAPVHLPIRSTQSERAGGYIVAAMLALAMLTYGAENYFAQRNTENQPETGKKRPSFILHLHPPTIPASQARWRYTLGAGGLAVFLCLILGITGILEMFFYVPTTEQAGLSIQTITFLVPFGALIRGIHFWAAQVLVVVSVIHLLRIVFTGSFVAPRQFNFLLGLGLLILTLLLNFTGYVLRWDEGIRWALLVGTNLLKTIPLIGAAVYRFAVGGESLGPATLTRFYTWHLFGLTTIVVFLLGWHIFRVRRDGGISARPIKLREASERISRSELLQREILAILIASALLVIMAIALPTPLAAPIRDANASAPLTEVRAPWFFLWVQQLLRYGDPFWMGVAIPLVTLAVLAALPYLFARLPDEQKGYWFPRAGRIAQLVAALIVLGWLALTILELVQ